MNAPLDELYLTWLYSQNGSVKLKSPQRTFWSLHRQMFTKEFIWLVPNDDNRVEDGRDLRREFLWDEGLALSDVGLDWMRMGCSFLEMLVALSRRLSFEDEGEPWAWFWQLLANLGLKHHNDLFYRKEHPENDVEEILDTVIWRRYNHDGVGGLFPLTEEAEDQRYVEIWYQLSAYLLEHESLRGG